MNKPAQKPEASEPDFDVSGMVDAALANGQQADAIRILLEAMLTNNRNMEEIARGVNNAIAAVNGSLQAMTALSARINALMERVHKIEKNFRIVH